MTSKKRAEQTILRVVALRDWRRAAVGSVYCDMRVIGGLVAALVVGTGWGQHPTLQTGGAKAQVPASQPPVVKAGDASAKAVEMTLPVVVLDKGGMPVTSLAVGDFTLQVDGHPQAIAKVEAAAELPLTVGLLVDTSAGQRGELDEEKTASGAFFEQTVSGPKDQGFVIQFAHEIELLQDATGSKAKLQTGLRQLGTTAPSSGVQTVSDDDADDRRSKSRLGTAMFDAVFLASDDVMGKQKGRKTLVLLTDGNDRDSKERITGAIEAAQRTDTVVYAIYLKGEAPKRENDRDVSQQGGNGGGYPGGGGGYPGGYPGSRYPGGGGYPRQSGRNPQPQAPSRNDGRKVLERLTTETGGRLFEVSKKESLADIYTEIGKEMRAQVRVRFTPDGVNAENGFHKIDLGLVGGDKKKWVVESRIGYFLGK